MLDLLEALVEALATVGQPIEESKTQESVKTRNGPIMSKTQMKIEQNISVYASVYVCSQGEEGPGNTCVCNTLEILITVISLRFPHTRFRLERI